jgi:uncharacterized SAM-binding protein YcdF (DUF218 family)
MHTLKRALEFCVSPLGVLTFLLVGGVALSATRKASRAGRRMAWTGALLFLLVLFTPVAEWLIADLERPFPAVRQADPGSGVRTIVVLSGYGEDHFDLPVTSKLWPDTLSRTVEGIRLFRQLPGARLIMSGGVLRTGDRPIAEQMADFAVALGVPRDAVGVERTSQTTYENLVEVKKMIGAEPFYLVNSACDLRRASAVARKLGMKPLPAPAGVVAAHHSPASLSWKAWGREALDGVGAAPVRVLYLQRAWHEYLGYAWYWLLRRV